MNDRNFHRRIGHIGVLAVKKELTQRGWDVFEPEMDCGVDLIAYRDGYRFLRIQVKTTSSGKVGQHWAKFIVSRVKYNKRSRHGYSDLEIDFMVGCCLKNNNFWIIPISDVAGRLKAFCTKTDKHYMNWDLLEKFEPPYAFKELKEMSAHRELRINHSVSQKRMDRMKRHIDKLIELNRKISKERNKVKALYEKGEETIRRQDEHYSRLRGEYNELYFSVEEKIGKIHEEKDRKIYDLEKKVSECNSKIYWLEQSVKNHSLGHSEKARYGKQVEFLKYRGLTKQFRKWADGCESTQVSPKMPDIFQEAA